MIEYLIKTDLFYRGWFCESEMEMEMSEKKGFMEGGIEGVEMEDR